MAKTVYYRQCTLHRPPSSGGDIQTVTWIPERFAQEGKVLKLKTETGEANGLMGGLWRASERLDWNSCNFQMRTPQFGHIAPRPETISQK